MNNKFLKKIIIIILLIVFSVIQFSFLSYLIKGLTTDNINKDELMKYTQKGKINYEVVLKDNELIPNEYKNKDSAYIVSLIDYIKVQPYYDFSSKTKSKISGTNKLYAKLKVYYKESSSINQNPEVLNKEDILHEEEFEFNDKKYDKVYSIELSLDKYLDILEKFKKDMKINVDGYLELVNEVDILGQIGNTSYNNSFSNVIKIPLNDSVSKIEAQDEQIDKSVVYSSNLVDSNASVKTYLVVVNVIVFLILTVLLKKLFKLTNVSEYGRKLKKILKNYDDIIVNTKSLVDVKKYKLIKITEFKEMLNLSRELLLPIMNYEMRPHEETCFYIIKDDLLYMHIICDGEKKQDKE